MIYTLEEPNPVPGRFGFHEIWHVCVILAALSHYALMLFIVLPSPCPRTCSPVTQRGIF